MKRSVVLVLGAITVGFGSLAACSTGGGTAGRYATLGASETRVLDPDGGLPIAPCCTEVYEELNGPVRTCVSPLECCSNVCTDGVCTCAALGGYCAVSSDCCDGRQCNTDQGCCLDDAGNCPNDGGNPWLDGQL